MGNLVKYGDISDEGEKLRKEIEVALLPIVSEYIGEFHCVSDYNTICSVAMTHVFQYLTK